MIKRLLLSAFIFLSIFHSYGQETTSQILGTVSDGKQGLGGATVVALHGPTGTKYTTTTRKDGRFNLEGLRVGGPYTLSVSYVGFKTETVENIVTVLGQDFTSDFTLTPEAKELATTIVSAARQNKIFNNAHTGTQELITRAQIEQLPTISRSIQDFTKLEPSSNGLSFAGTNPGENNITVDGADFNNSFGLSSTLGGQASAQPIALDAIDQIQVNVAPYDVRQGGFVGAGVNSVTRSGTNTFRGTIYDYIKGPGTQGYKADNVLVMRDTKSKMVFRPVDDFEGPMGHDEGSAELGDLLGMEDTAVEHTVDMEAVERHWHELPRREQQILLLRFYGNRSQEQVAAQLGLSQMHVSRLQARALARLRDRLLEPGGSAVGKAGHGSGGDA